MTRDALLERLHEVSRSSEGLFRVHRRHPVLYARARRMFGSWSEAVRSAGIDYERMVARARRRSRETLRARMASRRVSGSDGLGHDPDTAS